MTRVLVVILTASSIYLWSTREYYIRELNRVEVKRIEQARACTAKSAEMYARQNFCGERYG